MSLVLWATSEFFNSCMHSIQMDWALVKAPHTNLASLLLQEANHLSLILDLGRDGCEVLHEYCSVASKTHLHGNPPDNVCQSLA